MFGNWMKTAFLLTAMAALFMIVGYFVGGPFGMAIAFIIAIAMNFVSYFFSDKIVVKSYGAKPLSEAEAPRLHAILAELSAAAGIPKPPLYIMQQNSPNAFATGRNPQHALVCVTSGLTELLNEEEIKGVIAHEIAHIVNRDILLQTIVASFAAAIMFLAQMARWTALLGGGRDREGRGGGINMIAMLVAVILAPVAAMLIQMAISRSREYGADATGAKLAGTPNGLANALRKLFAASKQVPLLNAGPATAHMFIVKPFSADMLMNIFSTHPPLEKRVERLLGRAE